MSFQGMGDLSSDEVLFLRSGAKRCSTPPPVSHRHDESQPPIPQRVGLHRSPPPLQRPVSSSRQPAGNVNLHPNWVGEFSPGEMRNFHPALTIWDMKAEKPLPMHIRCSDKSVTCCGWSP